MPDHDPKINKYNELQEIFGYGTSPLPRKLVSSSYLLPDNKTGGNKVMISGDPYQWDRYQWIRDYQARPGEYDYAPICSDPENVKLLF